MNEQNSNQKNTQLKRKCLIDKNFRWKISAVDESGVKSLKAQHKTNQKTL